MPPDTLICINARRLSRPYLQSMMDPLVLRPLEQGRIRQAFPLVQAILPDLTLARWAGFARRYTPEGKDRTIRGIMAAENQPGYIVGLFTYQTRDELTLGHTLGVGNLLVADFPGREQAVAYIVDGIETMANLRGCNAIAVDLDVAFSGGSPTCGWSLRVFERNGFVATSVSQCRKVLPTRRRGLAPALADSMPLGDRVR